MLFFYFIHPSKVLLQHRDNKKNINHPNTWCPPGGHCEINEIPLNCAKRELREETGYQAKILYYHSASTYPLDKLKPHIILNFWGVYDQTQEIDCYEGQTMEFIEVDRLNKIKIFPYNINLIKKILSEENYNKYANR